MMVLEADLSVWDATSLCNNYPQYCWHHAQLLIYDII